jgi:hypothetical protein
MGRIGSMKRLALITMVFAIAMLTAVPAYAQKSVGDGYGGLGAGAVNGVSKGGGGGGSIAGVTAAVPNQSSVATSSLPFTGLDIGLLAAGGIVLVGVGVGLRRFTRPLN